MLAPSPAGFRRLWPLLKPHRRRLAAGGLCMLVYVACWPVLAWLAGQLIPAIGAGDFAVVLRSVGAALAVFLVQKVAQFGQDTLLAGRPCR
jgi:ATP-binding cassette subfamily B protein